MQKQQITCPLDIEMQFGAEAEVTNSVRNPVTGMWTSVFLKDLVFPKKIKNTTFLPKSTKKTKNRFGRFVADFPKKNIDADLPYCNCTSKPIDNTPSRAAKLCKTKRSFSITSAIQAIRADLSRFRNEDPGEVQSSQI